MTPASISTRSIRLTAALLLAVFIHAGAVRANQTVRLQLKWKHQFQFAGYYAALEKGFYGAEGLDVVIREGAPNLFPIDAVMDGEADYGVAGPEALLARVGGKPVVILAAVFQHSPRGIIVRKDAGVYSVQDLIGKTVAMGSQLEVVAENYAMLLVEGVPLNSLKIIDDWDLNNLINGTIDAYSCYMTVQPFELEKMGVPFSVFRPGAYGIDFYGDCLFTSEAEIKSRPGVASAFRRASLRGWQYAMAHPDEIIDLILNKYITAPGGKTRAHLVYEADAMRDLIHPELIQIGHINPGRWAHIADMYVRLGVIENDYSLDGFIYNPVQKRFDWGHWAVQWGAALLFVSIGAVMILFLANRRINREVNERKQTEIKLKESEQRYRTLFERNLNPIAVIDANGRYVNANQTFLDFVEKTRDDLMHMSVFDFSPPDKKNKQESNHRPVWGAGGVLETEYYINGKTKLLELTITPVFYEGMDAIVGVGKDVTARRLAESKLRESEEKYRSMMESMADAVYICSQEFKIEYMNPAMVRRVGRDATGEPCYEIMHGLDRKCPWCPHARVMTGASVNIEIISPKDERTYYVSNSPVFHANGSVSKLTVYRDVTDIKKMEARLRQAQKMEAVGSLAGGIAHDFNNILFPLLGYAEMIKEDAPPESPVHSHIDEVIRAGLRARDLVKQILTFSRQSRQEMKPMLLQPVVKEAMKLLRASIPTTIEFRLDIDPDCGMVLADPTQIHQIVMNLATNAFHAMETGGGVLKAALSQVRLELDLSGFPELIEGEYARLIIADTGAGIEKEMMDRVFDPYFTTKHNDKGTGLGLSMVRGIVQSCKGDVRIYSEPGQGAEVHVYLPILNEKQDGDIAEDAELPRGGGERILLADDEAPIVRMERQMLERLGYSVSARTGSVEALEAFKADPDAFDLVITDLTMPNMTGVQLAREIKKIRPAVPVIICTGFTDRISAEKCKSLGLQGVVIKPVIRREIAAVIRGVLEKTPAE